MTTAGDNTAVVLVHGIWMHGVIMSVLAHRLEDCGFTCRTFTYSSVSETPVQNAVQLHEFVRRLDADTVHLVAHSLGGIVVLHLFERYNDLAPGRIVLLGSPVNSSTVAERLTSLEPGRWVLGQSVQRALLGGAPTWRGERELGVVAGTWSMGVGRLLGGLDGPDDGTVTVAETHLANSTDSVTAPVTHTGMVFSAEVAEQVCTFLRTGRFHQVR